MVLQTEQNMAMQFNKDLKESDVISSSTALSVSEFHKQYSENKEK